MTWPTKADHQRMIAWGPGYEGYDGDWVLDEEWVRGMLHDSGAITFRVSYPDIAWEEDGDIEVVLDTELAAYLVRSYVAMHGVPPLEDEQEATA